MKVTNLLLQHNALVLLFMIIYLTMDAYEDYKGGVKGAEGHKNNALVRSIAIAGMILISLYPFPILEYPGHWTLVLFSLSTFLFFFGWFYFDLTYNFIAKKPLFTYLGSGSIDKAFKREYLRRAAEMMLMVKIVMVLLSFSFHCFTLYLYLSNF